MLRQRRILVGLAAVAAGILLSVLPVIAQPGTEDLRTQILRLQRDMRDLQQEVFRNGGPRPGQPLPPPPAVDVAPPSGDSPAAVYAMTKLADSAAMARSAAQTRLIPAPAATPLTAASKRKMPFIMEPDHAADAIWDAILAKKAVHAFPLAVVTAMQTVSGLPTAVYDRLVPKILR